MWVAQQGLSPPDWSSPDSLEPQEAEGSVCLAGPLFLGFLGE